MKYQIVLLLIPLWAQAGSVTLAPGEYIAEGGWGTLQLTQPNVGVMKFSISTLSANAHICELAGEIHNGNATLEGVGPDQPCSINFVPKGNDINVVAVDVSACRDYCGARASFEAVYLKPVAGCDTQSRKSTKKEFKKLYDKKEYSKAHAVLERIHTQCKPYLDWREAGRVDNDLAITRYKLGDKDGCAKVLAEYAEDAALPDAEIDTLRLPSDAPDYAAIVRAARTNLKLCTGKTPKPTKR